MTDPPAPPHWKCQPASYLPDAGYQTTPTFMTLWEERLSLKRSRMAHVIPQGHRVFSKHITPVLACFSLLLRTPDTRQREKENMQFPIGVGWRETLMSVKQWMAVKDSCAPFVAANDSCSDEMGMKGWRQAIKCVVLQLFNQTLVCLLSRMVQQRSSREQVAPSPPLMFRRLHPNLQSYRFMLSSSVLLQRIGCLKQQQVREAPLPPLSYAPSQWRACSNLVHNWPQCRLWPFANNWKK